MNYLKHLVICALLTLGVLELRAQDTLGAALFEVVRSGDFDSAKAMIEDGADLEYLDYSYGKKMSEQLLSNPIGAIVSVMAFPFTFFDLLFGERPTYTNSLFNAAIIHPPSLERDAFITFLHDKGLDPDHGNIDLLMPLLAQGQDSLALKFIDWGAPIESYGRQLLSYAILKEDSTLLNAFIQRGISAASPNYSVPIDPLFLAVERGDSALIYKILEVGGNPNLAFRQGDYYSSLTLQLIEQKDSIYISMFSDLGIKPRGLKNVYPNSLDRALEHEDLDYLKFLIKQGFNPIIRDNSNVSNLATVARSDDSFSLQALSFLISLNYPAEHKEEALQDALSAAIENGNLPGVQILLNYGVRPSAATIKSMYFHLEKFTYDLEMIPIIDMVHEEKESYSYLHGQAFIGLDQNDSALLCKTLSKAKELNIDLQQTESGREDLLYFAVDELRTESVKILFDFGFDPTPIVTLLPSRDFWWRDYYENWKEKKEKMKTILQHLDVAGAPLDSLESFWKEPIY